MCERPAVRDVQPADEAGWRRLWEGYVAFYGATVAAEVTAHTWSRILDPRSPILGRVAVLDGAVQGFSVCVLHEGTWVAGPVCYLEDLFVAPGCRGMGLGRMLIQDLVGLGRERNWSTLYWHTGQDNPARQLYDGFAPADGFVRYRLPLDAR